MKKSQWSFVIKLSSQICEQEKYITKVKKIAK